jgi:predicted TIM-barrel fold metal-dependent hydrolase
MIIDCHYHLERRLLPDDELLKKMNECEVDKVALMGVISEPIPKPPEFLLNILRFSLTHSSFRFLAKSLGTNFTPDGNMKIPTGIFQLYPDPKNEPVFKIVADYPDRFLGWVFVNPRGEKDPIHELNKWKDTPGFIGVKAHPFWHRYDPIELFPVADQLSKTGKPLLIHAGFDAYGDYDVLLQQVPDLKLILAHAGFPLYSDTWNKIKNNKNVYVDLSQTSYLNDKTTRQAVEYLGAEKCLFGTDGPYGVHGGDDLFDYSFIKRRIEKLFPDKGIQKRLFGENFLELVDI